MNNANLSGSLDAILFDKDGTLLDFQATWGRWGANAVLELSGGDTALAETLAQELGLDLEKGEILKYSVVVAGSPAEIGETAAMFLPGLDAKSFADRFVELSENVVPVPLGDVNATFDALVRHGLRLGVATNDGEQVALNQMQKLGLTDCLDYIVGFDSGYGGKPGSGMCLGFCEKFGIPPERVAMVGDSLHDMHAGRAAGMVCIAVTSGLASASDLCAHADIVLGDIHELPELFA